MLLFALVPREAVIAAPFAATAGAAPAETPSAFNSEFFAADDAAIETVSYSFAVTWFQANDEGALFEL